MSIEEILNEMDELLLDSRHLPFTNKIAVEENDLVVLIDKLRELIPEEINEANNLLQERENIIKDAKCEADRIVEQAKSYAIKLTDNHEIVKMAQEQANTIIEQAKKNSRELKADSMNYADEVFKHLISNVGGALKVIEAAHADLNSNKNKRA